MPWESKETVEIELQRELPCETEAVVEEGKQWQRQEQKKRGKGDYFFLALGQPAGKGEAAEKSRLLLVPLLVPLPLAPRKSPFQPRLSLISLGQPGSDTLGLIIRARTEYEGFSLIP